MFGHKKKVRLKMNITLSDENGAVLYSGPLTQLAIPDELVVALSKEFFNDPTPCEIHRNAVLARAFLSIEEALSAQEAVEIASLDPGVRSLFSAYSSARRALLQ